MPLGSGHASPKPRGAQSARSCREIVSQVEALVAQFIPHSHPLRGPFGGHDWPGSLLRSGTFSGQPQSNKDVPFKENAGRGGGRGGGQRFPPPRRAHASSFAPLPCSSGAHPSSLRPPPRDPVPAACGTGLEQMLHASHINILQPGLLHGPHLPPDMRPFALEAESHL